LLATGLLVWAIVAMSIDNGHVGVFHDDGIYLVSAQAIRDGRGYQLPSRPGNPPPKYPIGFPLALALALRGMAGPGSLDRDLLAARIVVTASGLLFFATAYRWMRVMRVPPAVATAVVLATAFHQATLVGCGCAVFSDLTFCGLTYFLLLMLAGTRKRSPGTAVGTGLASGLLAGAGYLVRGNGITLMVATLLDSGRKRRRSWRWAGNVAGMAMVLFAVKWVPVSRVRAVPSGDYGLEMQAGWSSLRAGLAIVITNLAAVLLDFPTRVLLPVTSYSTPIVRVLRDHPLAAIGLRLGLSSLVLLGLIRLARLGRGRALPAWFHVLATMAIFLVWPWTMIMDRFLLGVVPLVLLAFWAGLCLIGQRIAWLRHSRLAPSRLALGALVVATVGIACVTARSVSGFHFGSRQWPGASSRRSLSEALSLISTRLEPSAVLAARWPETVYLYTGRQGVPLTEDDDILRGRFDRSDRLRLWMDQVPGRPFYLLVRGQLEDPALADRRQAESLARTNGLELQPFAQTSDGRYALVRVLRH